MKQKSPKSPRDYSLVAVLLLTGSYILLGGVIFYQLSYDLVSGRLQAQLTQIVQQGNIQTINPSNGSLESVQPSINQQNNTSTINTNLNQGGNIPSLSDVDLEEFTIKPRFELNQDLLRDLRVGESDIQSMLDDSQNGASQVNTNSKNPQSTLDNLSTQVEDIQEQANSSESLSQLQNLTNVLNEIEVEQKESKNSIVQELEESYVSTINEVTGTESVERLSLPERGQVNDSRSALRPLTQERVEEILQDESLSEEAREVIREVAVKTDDVVSEVDRALKKILSNTDQSFSDIESSLELYLSEVESIVEGRLGRDVDLSGNRQEVAEQVQLLRQSIEIQKDRLIERGGQDLFLDDDEDGLSNYDELNIYGTDPQVASTAGSPRTDGQKIALGLNPLIAEDSPMDFESPKETGNIVEGLYEIETIDTVNRLVTEMSPSGTAIRVAGTALPNSFVSVYVYSTPIVAVVKTDDQGNWEYTVTQELEDGRHEVYTASVNNTGKIIARSAPTSFVKQAAAVQILDGAEGNVNLNVPTVAESADSGLETRYILVGFGALVSVLLLAIVVVGYQVSQEEKKAH